MNLLMAPLAEMQEFEADYAGLILGARSGYDPVSMLSVLRKLGPEPHSPLSMHARADDRFARAEAALETARRVRSSALSRR